MGSLQHAEFRPQQPTFLEEFVNGHSYPPSLIADSGTGRRRSEGTRWLLPVLLGLCCLLVQIASPAHAQSFYGSIGGTVTDAGGAVIPDATVSVTNLATTETHVVKTNGAGEYSIVNLVPDNYRLDVSKENFKHFVREPLAVQVGSAMRIDPALQIGAVTETVEVTSQAPLLQTDTSGMGQTISGVQVQQTPLNGRNIMNMIALAPGVVAQGSTSGGAAMSQHGDHTSNQAWNNYQVGGAIAGESATYVDGAPVNVLGQNTVGLIVTQDAIQEFSVSSSNANSDFGRYGGGVINMTTKSGANQFHGTAYEYLRNADFNANNYFSNLQGAPRPKYNQNQFGVAITGPLKRDKLFFLFTWEGFHSIIGQPSPSEVPTTAMQNGVFTNAITDPLGRCNIVHDPVAGTWTITNLFVGNCGDPTAKVLKTFYPPPNTNITGANYFYTPNLYDNQNQYNGRVDYTLSQKQRLFARYTYWAINDTGFNTFDNYNGWPTENAYSVNYSQQAVLGDTYAFNANTVLDLRFDYLREYYPNLPLDQNVDEGQFGSAYAALAAQESLHVIPVYTLTGLHSLTGFSSATTFSQAYYNNYVLSGNVIRIQGRHSLKFGVEARRMEQSGTGTDSEAGGLFTFTNTYSGDEWANFLMGYYSTAAIQTFDRTTAYNYYQAYYATDTWQAKRNLTFDLGLRYELPGGIAEKNNKATVLLPSAVDPYTNVTGTLALVDSPLYPHRPTVLPKFDLFAPHVGFIYQAGPNTAVRGGYGISYLPPDIQAAVLPSASLVNAGTTTIINTAGTPSYFLDNPFPNGINQPVGRTNPAFMKNYIGQAISGAVPFQKYPYIQQWNLEVSRQLRGNWLVDIGYAGSKGTHIPGIGTTTYVGQDLNQLPDGYDSLGAGLLTKAPCAAASGQSMTVGQCLRPYPSYLNVTDSADFIGYTNYNSLQAKLTKRFGNGGELLANYTYAKQMGDTDTAIGTLETKATPTTRGGGYGQIQDFNNLRGEYSTLSYNVPHRAVISYVYNLPFGHGQRFGNSLAGPFDSLASGWNVSGITTFQSGFPLDITDSGASVLTTNFGGGILRPNVVPGCQKHINASALQRVKNGAWFNTSCFSYPGQYAFGNEPRVDPTLYSEGVDNFDFAAEKNTRLVEKFDLRFRAEFFNVFNRVQFAPPVVQRGSSQFGQILAQANQPREIQFSLRLTY